MNTAARMSRCILGLLGRDEDMEAGGQISVNPLAPPPIRVCIAHVPPLTRQPVTISSPSDEVMEVGAALARATKFTSRRMPGCQRGNVNTHSVP
jgi:hypothetical protein